MLPLLPALLAGTNVLVVGTLADPLSLDPHRATDLVSAAIVENVCETLVRLRPDGSRPQPALATTWATRDNRDWTFTLREGVRFHDGTPFDADAVVANIRRLREKRGFPGEAFRVGPHVVSVTLDRPNAALLATLSQPFFSLQSPLHLGDADVHPVGTGPFRLGRIRPGRVELRPNPDYWGGPPPLERLIFRRYRDEHALLAALLAGRVDVTTALGQDQIGRARRSPDVVVEIETGLNIALLSLNNDRAPFSDRRVRQALARGIDRDTLVSEVLAGYGEPARNPIPPSLWGYGRRTKALILDRSAARRLLTEAGWPDGFDTTLLTVDVSRPYLPAPLALAARIRTDLAAVGIRVRIEQAPSWAAYLERGSQGSYEMAVFGWQADTTDPNDFLTALLDSESIGSTNRSRYRSEAMDSLLKRGRRVGQPAERLAVYQQVQELFQRDMPWVPLYHVSSFTAHRREVEGLTVTSTGSLRYDHVRKSGP